MNERRWRNKGRYAIVKRKEPRKKPWPDSIGQNTDIYYEVWNGNNNAMLTRGRFDTPREAREWAEKNGYEVRFTKTHPNYEEGT